MSLTIKEATTKSQFKQFVQFQFDHYKDSEQWVPPIKKAEIKSLLPEYNPSFEFCKTKFWMAIKNNTCVGTIGAIVNEKYIAKTGEKTGRFTRFECIDDHEVAELLLKTAEDWLKEQGMTRVQGPLGFSNLDTQGMLIEGFEYLPSIGSVYHKPYYRELVESCGYEKEIDWIEFRLTVGEKAINKANRGAELVKKRYGIEVVHFKEISELLPYTDMLFQILNDAFSELPFVIPFSDKMIDYYKGKYIKMLNPEFVKMAKMKDEVIGFVIGMPSLSEAMQKTHGKLFPFGFRHLLKARKGNDGDTMDQMLTGVKHEHQATGAAVVLMAELQNVMLSKGMKFIETTGIFETNHNAISNWKNYEHIQHKRRRCFVKSL